jgi:hypothetical protein
MTINGELGILIQAYRKAWNRLELTVRLSSPLPHHGLLTSNKMALIPNVMLENSHDALVLEWGFATKTCVFLGFLKSFPIEHSITLLNYYLHYQTQTFYVQHLAEIDVGISIAEIG